MTPYADTSFLTAVFVLDAHTPSAASIMAATNEPILISTLSDVELCNAIQLRVFRKSITLADAQASHGLFSQDLLAGIFDLQPISAATFEEAKILARKYTSTLGTRSLDLMHVASALTLKATAFLSFDRNQRRLAQAAGVPLYPQTL